jgi:hypothetical protein
VQGVGLAGRSVDAYGGSGVFDVLIVRFLLEGEEMVEFLVTIGHRSSYIIKTIAFRVDSRVEDRIIVVISSTPHR